MGSYPEKTAPLSEESLPLRCTWTQVQRSKVLGRRPGSEARPGRVKEGMHTHPAELHTGNASENSADFMEMCESSAHTRGKQEDTRRYLCCVQTFLLGDRQLIHSFLYSADMSACPVPDATLHAKGSAGKETRVRFSAHMRLAS